MKIFFRLLTFIKPFAGMVSLSILYGTATIASGIGLLGTSAHLIASAALHPSIGSLQVAIVGVRLFGISRAAFRYIERLTTHSLNFKILSNMRVWFYRKIEPLAPARLVHHRSGDLLARAVADIEELENFYIRVVSPPITALIITLGVSLFVGKYSPTIGLVVASGMLLNGVVLPWVIYRVVKQGGRKSVADRASISAELIEMLQGMEDIQAFNLEEKKYGVLNELNRQYSNSRLRVTMAGNLADSASVLLTHVTVCAFLILAIPIVSNGAMSGVILTTLTLVIMAGFESIYPLSTAAQYFESCMQAAHRLFDMVDVPAEIHQAPGNRNRITGPLEIQFNDLNFRYPGTPENVLHHINFSIDEGEHIAIIGPSGAGKSTLANLLMRFWEYRQGSIMINQVELNTIDLSSVRDMMTLNNQRSYIFNATLRDNLLLADENSNDHQMMDVIESVNLMRWFQSLPDGLDTWLGEHGVQMSGGEKQRLSIARALLRKSPLMIFDEPFSNLDINNEDIILDNVHSATTACTSIWITHHLMKMDYYSKIYLMKAGRVIEWGTHESLFEQDGQYARLVKLQTMEFDFN